MFEIIESELFAEWFGSLRDQAGKAAIQRRIRRIVDGNFGDVAPVGSGVSEIRVNSGPGYRVYFIQRGKTVILLLCGGDKSSQSRDIMRARKIASDTESRRP